MQKENIDGREDIGNYQTPLTNMISLENESVVNTKSFESFEFSPFTNPLNTHDAHNSHINELVTVLTENKALLSPSLSPAQAWYNGFILILGLYYTNKDRLCVNNSETRNIIHKDLFYTERGKLYVYSHYYGDMKNNLEAFTYKIPKWVIFYDSITQDDLDDYTFTHIANSTGILYGAMQICSQLINANILQPHNSPSHYRQYILNRYKELSVPDWFMLLMGNEDPHR